MSEANWVLAIDLQLMSIDQLYDWNMSSNQETTKKQIQQNKQINSLSN